MKLRLGAKEALVANRSKKKVIGALYKERIAGQSYFNEKHA